MLPSSTIQMPKHTPSTLTAPWTRPAMRRNCIIWEGKGKQNVEKNIVPNQSIDELRTLNPWTPMIQIGEAPADMMCDVGHHILSFAVLRASRGDKSGST